MMADLEQTYFNNNPFTIQGAEPTSNLLLNEVDGMVHSLSGQLLLSSGHRQGH
jgi:hypothetical protein